jgi:hypothetical protein
VQIVRDLLPRLPQVAPVAVSALKNRSRFARVDARFVEASSAAVAATTAVQLALGRTDADVRQAAADAAEWSIAIDAVRQLFAELAEANRRRRQLVGLTALQTYAICSQLARETQHAEALAPHVAAMKRLKPRTARRTKQPSPQQQ